MAGASNGHHFVGHGQQSHENGYNSHIHMQHSLPPAPPLPPLEPDSIASLPAGPNATASPMNGGGIVRRAAPEPNKRALYVGGLDQRISEDVLRKIFETTGTVANVKIIPDKNVSGQVMRRSPCCFWWSSYVDFGSEP